MPASGQVIGPASDMLNPKLHHLLFRLNSSPLPLSSQTHEAGLSFQDA